MSRAGNKPINIKQGVNVVIENGRVKVSSKRGELEIKILDRIVVENKDNHLIVTKTIDSPEIRAKHGLIARLIKNAISDLTDGVSKDLEFVGTGYRVKVEREKLILTVGYSHDIILEIPKGISLNIKKNIIHLEGYDRMLVGEFAAKVRNVRSPEVYKGKGIRYSSEHVKRKAGKAAQAVGKE